MQVVRLKDIVRDENQPRKSFDARKLHTLAESIKTEGIISPLIVEELGNGKYLLIDGERRHRAAETLGLDKVPVIVEPQRDAKERKVRQFIIQEQHADWTPIEKAKAISDLSVELDISVRDVCDMVGIPPNDKDRYIAFASILNKTEYVANEVSLDFAPAIRSLINFAKKVTVETLQDNFTASDERALEKKIIGQVRQGIIKRRNDVVRLKDGFNKNPKMVAKYMDNKDATPESIFAESKAAGAHHLRNGLMTMQYVTNSFRKFLETKDMTIDSNMAQRMRECRDVLTEVLELAE